MVSTKRKPENDDHGLGTDHVRDRGDAINVGVVTCQSMDPKASREVAALDFARRSLFAAAICCRDFGVLDLMEELNTLGKKTYARYMDHIEGRAGGRTSGWRRD